jgi:sigma-B regulation protein RsbQ
MKYLLLFAVAFTLACGAPTDRPAGSQIAPLAPGPGNATAPDGIAIAYTVAGSGAPALVFIHGWMCDQTFWSEQVEAFAVDHAVVTLDLPGHGLSGMDRDNWSLMAYGADVRAVVAHLDLHDVVLIGHSMGGPVALEAARLMPERVIAVVAVDALHNADVKFDPDAIQRLVAAYENDWVGTCQEFSASMFPDGADPALIERVTDAMCDGPPEIGLTLTRQFFDYELAPALAAVSVPVRFINSAGYPTNIEVNRKYQPNFDGVVMSGVGHFLMMEQPGAFNEQLRKVLATLDQPPE